MSDPIPFSEAELVRQIHAYRQGWPATMIDCKRWGQSLGGSAWPLYLEDRGENRHGTPRPSHGVHVQFRAKIVQAEFKDYTGDETRLIKCEWTHRQWCDLMAGTEQLDLFGDAV